MIITNKIIELFSIAYDFYKEDDSTVNKIVICVSPVAKLSNQAIR